MGINNALVSLFMVSVWSKSVGGCAWAEAVKKADKGKQKGILERDRPT